MARRARAPSARRLAAQKRALNARALRIARSRFETAAAERFLAALPEQLRVRLAAGMREAAPFILGRARGETPSLRSKPPGGRFRNRTRTLRSALRAEFDPQRLALRVGLLTRQEQGDHFYGWILDKGRRARTVRVTRRLKNARFIAGAPGRRGRWSRVVRYALRVSPIAPQTWDIVRGRTRAFAQRLVRRMAERVLDVIARTAP